MFRILFILLTFLTIVAQAQRISPSDLIILQKQEDSLKPVGFNMVLGSTPSERASADSLFIRSLVKSLRVPYSFDYPFDSLLTVSRIYAPDSTFRIFTWQISHSDDRFRQKGAIQLKTSDGSLKLYPLFDISDFTEAPQDSVRTVQNWIGAIYYNMVMKNFNNKSYYTLLGFDDNNSQSSKKFIEVLTFNEKGEPVFGGPFFIMDDGNRRIAPFSRFLLEYKKEGRARLNYDAEMDLIMYDHLVSETNEPDKAFTMVPDGDYQAFKWQNGKWNQIDKVFDQKLEDGEAPLPAPIMDADGKTKEAILQEQSDKNARRKVE